MKRALVFGTTQLSMLLMLLSVAAGAQQVPTITIVNRSADEAFVRICGPTLTSVALSSGGQRTVGVSGGSYYLKIRYGAAGRYHFAKGQTFSVTQDTYRVSIITITLHSANGNLNEREISAAEFASER